MEHEVRTTLWEVISEQIGLTGTVRSCNRATCGVCTVVIDGTPIYSCHMLACEAAEKPILTVEGLGDEKTLDPIQEIVQRLCDEDLVLASHLPLLTER